MTHQRFLEWQFQNGLDDTWWVAIADSPSTRHYSLLEVKALKEASQNSMVSLLHAVYTDDANAEWHEYELPESAVKAPPALPPPIPQKGQFIKHTIQSIGVALTITAVWAFGRFLFAHTLNPLDLIVPFGALFILGFIRFFPRKVGIRKGKTK